MAPNVGLVTSPPYFTVSGFCTSLKCYLKSGEVIIVLLTRIKDRNYKLRSDLFQSGESVISELFRVEVYRIMSVGITHKVYKRF